MKYAIVARSPPAVFYYSGKGKWSDRKSAAVRYATRSIAQHALTALQKSQHTNGTRQIARVEET